MGTRPLTPGGGRGDRLGFRVAQGQGAQLDEIAERLGYSSRSEYVRALIDRDLASQATAPEEKIAARAY